jgi:MFS family permease
MLVGQGVNIGLQHVYWGWRMSYSLNGIFALLLFVGLSTYMPESPRFIASRHSKETEEEECLRIRHEQLKIVMQKLRYEQDVDHAIQAIEMEVQEDRELGEASWSEVLSTDNKMRYRILLGIAIQAFNQLSGNEAINFYSPTIMENMFGGQSIFLSFVIGIVNFIAVCVSLLTIDRFGRLPLFFAGGVTMFLTQVANSIYQSLDQSSTTIDALFFVSLCVFSFAYHGTW